MDEIKSTSQDYFYVEQAEQFVFYRIPKILFSENRYKEMSTDAKLLYGLFLDRVALSIKNKWVDDLQRVYIIYTVQKIQEILGCADKKTTKLLKELEIYGLIERKRVGLGKPDIIYVKNFITARGLPNMNRERDDSGTDNKEVTDTSKARCNNTEFNNIDYNDNNLIISEDTKGYDRYAYQFCLEEQLQISNLKQQFPFDKEILDGILELMLDVLDSSKKRIRISGEDKPLEVVKSRFMKLNDSHIQYVLECFKANNNKVRNIPQYLLSSLYNAPVTIDAYYKNMVNHDMYGGIDV